MNLLSIKTATILSIILALSGCAGLPKGVEPVSGFELSRYTGKWYEIARLDHKFERGLERVSTTYSLNDDGTVRVANRGFSTQKKTWKEAIGKAKFSGEPDIGQLKVSFFGPFYSPYVIFELDKENYQYAFITSSNDSLWLLSRTPQISDHLKLKFIDEVTALGYPSDELIFVQQE
jgi:apolipoprotein D and lipocalin family protein